MIHQALNGMIQLMMAKFMLNDIPHSAGLVNPGHEEPPTPAQLRYIAILSAHLHISVYYEEQVRTKGEAGRMIRELKEEEKHRKSRRV